MERRFYLGVGVLVLFLILGLASLFFLSHVHAPISEQLALAQQASLSGDLTEGADLARQAKAIWKNYWFATAAFADHTPMDEIDGLFGELEVYAQAKENVHFAACCANLAQKVQAITDAHSPAWWNLL